MRSTPESGARAGYDGAKRRNGSKPHLTVDTLGHLLALHVTPADVGDRTAVDQRARDVQAATGDSVEPAFVDQGYTGEATAAAAGQHGIELSVVKLPEAKRGIFYCSDAGRSNSPSPGRSLQEAPLGTAEWSCRRRGPAFGASLRTTKGLDKLRPTFTSSLSSASCSKPPLNRPRVHNSG